MLYFQTTILPNMFVFSEVVFCTSGGMTGHPTICNIITLSSLHDIYDRYLSHNPPVSVINQLPGGCGDHGLMLSRFVFTTHLWDISPAWSATQDWLDCLPIYPIFACSEICSNYTSSGWRIPSTSFPRRHCHSSATLRST